MVNYRQPGVYHEDASSFNEPIQAANLSVAGFMGVTEWGPVNEPTLVQSFTEYLRMFGGYQDDSDMAYAVKGFFDNGGTQVYINRLAHYTDITDESTGVGAAATSGNLADRAGTPDDTLLISAKYEGEYGNDLDVALVKNSLHSSTLASASGYGSSSVSVSNPSRLYVGAALKFEGLISDPTTLAGAIIAANLIKDQMNAHFADTTVHNAADGDNVIVAPDATNQSTLNTLVTQIKDFYEYHRTNDDQGGGVDSGTYHTTKDTTNTITSADATDLATSLTLLAEIIDDFTAHIANATSHEEADTTNTLVVTEYGKVQSFTTTVTDGVPVHVITLIAAKTYGQAVTSTAVESMEFDITVYFENSVDPVETWTGLSMESDVANYALAVVNNETTGSIYIALSNLASTSGSGANMPADLELTAMTGGLSPINGGAGTGLAVVDIIGDATSKTGLYAFDDIDEIGIITTIPNTQGESTNGNEYSVGYIHGALAWAEDRKTTAVFVEGSPASTVAQVLTSVNSAGYNNKYGIMYLDRIKIIDPIGTDSETRYVSSLGHIAGKFAYVDNLPKGGVWETPAGSKPYGNIVGALGTERIISKNDLGLLNEAGVNVIRSFKNEGVLIFGGRTLDRILKWRYINVMRTFMYAQVSVSQSLNRFTFRNNNQETWAALKNDLTDFFTEMWNDGGLVGTSPDQAFYVKVGEVDGVQTATDTLNGRIIHEIGIAPQRPGEFLIFRWAQVQNQNGELTIL